MSAPVTRTATSTSSLLDLVGNTPLLRLRKFEDPARAVELYAKAEWYNPGGSVKDRPARRMILHGLESGALRPGKRILDATSGNTGIAYAMMGAALDYPVRLCVPTNVSEERKRILRAYAAELVFTDPLEGSDGAIREARRLYASDPDQYFYPDQYNNDENWRAHYHTTGPEILRQTEGRVTHFVAGLGTSGTFVGTARRLKEEKPDVRVISMQPDSPMHGLEGLKHMASALVPGIYDPALADEDLGVATEDAYTYVRRMAREEGILAGVSAGAALAACLKVSATLEAGVVVTVFPDSADKYLSERFWDQEP